MICQVKMIRPDGSRARHVGHYPNPGMAMDVVQALHPDCTVNAATSTQAAAPAVHSKAGRSCDELGVCQSVSKPCVTSMMCARKNSPFYFAPGTIEGGSSDLHQDAAGWVLNTTWKDWAAGVVILVALGAICGYLA